MDTLVRPILLTEVCSVIHLMEKRYTYKGDNCQNGFFRTEKLPIPKKHS